ncbi:MAG: hypothetical protein KDC95_12740, partial [Planctomycetes bacterium]|nr:hypothetical protein [Planctomycetota bacterium]
MTLRIASLAAVLLVASAALSQTPQGESESLSPQALAERGLDDDAIAAWRHQIAQNGSDRAPRIALIDFLLAKDRFNDALDEARAAIEAIPRDFDLLMRMTLACQRKGEALALTLGGRTSSKDWFVDVIRWAGEASAIAPSKHEPYAIRGMARFGLGRFDEAKEDAETLIRVAKDHPSGYLLLADCLFEEYQAAKKDAEADKAKALATKIESAVDTALALDPKRFLGWRRRGDVLAWEGKIDEATNAWSEALGLDPERGTPYDWIRDNVDAKLRIAMFTRAL